MRCSPLLLAPGCVWLTEGEYLERIDADGDGIPSALDCNDDPLAAGAIDFLDGRTGDLACGVTVTGDVDDAPDLLEFVNCAHPVHDGDLVELGWREHLWRFTSAVESDVTIAMGASDFW